MIIEPQVLNEVLLLKPLVYKDGRGHFFESFRQNLFEEIGLELNFVQDNEVFSTDADVLRGLHYQLKNPQGKLVHVVAGAIKDVVADVRIGSPNFGRSMVVNLDSKSHNMIYVPEGFAHGYLVLEKNTIIQYKCTDYYDSASENGVFWNDKDLNISWGVSDPILSHKDSELPLLRDQDNLPSY